MNHTPITIAQFLADHASQHFCASCLAFALKIDLQTVRENVGCLSQDLVIVHDRGICAVCSRVTPTYGLAPKGAEPADEVVVRFFAASPAGTAVCYGCLAEELGLSYHEIHKDAARLRVAGVTRIFVGRCTRCGRLRTLVQPKQRTSEPTSAGSDRRDPSPNQPLWESLGGDNFMGALANFLVMNSGQSYCRLCLVRVLHADPHEMTTALAMLRLSQHYRMAAGACAVCGKPRVTIGRA
jgi:hypothetical protein